MSPKEEEVYQKRDIMMARMDENLQHLVNWTKDHEEEDEYFQEKTVASLDDLKSFKFRQIGGVAVLLVVVQIAIKLFIK